MTSDQSRDDKGSREIQFRWHQLCLAQLASMELQRAAECLQAAECLKAAAAKLSIPNLWACNSDMTAAECVQAAAAKFPCNSSDVPSSLEERALASLRSSAGAYSDLRSLAGGAGVKGSSFACQAVRTASRLLRDLIVWRSFGLGGMASIPKFLDVLGLAFEEIHLNDDSDLKSQMLQARSKELLNLGLAQPRAVPKRKGKKKKGLNKNNDCFEEMPEMQPSWPMATSWFVPYPMLFPEAFHAFCPIFWHDEEDPDHDFELVETHATTGADDHLSIPDTDFSFAYPRAHRSPSQQESAGQAGDVERQEEAAECVSIPGTEESWMFMRAEHNLHSEVDKEPTQTFTKPVSKKDSLPRRLESIPDLDGLDIEVESAESEQATFICEECDRQDPNGWHWHNHYWCGRCWEKWAQEEDRRSKELKEQSDDRVPKKLSYDMMEKIYCQDAFKTEVRVVTTCCLTAACIDRSHACIVAFHPGIVINSQNPGAKWPLATLCERTSFGNEFKGDAHPRWGGFYLPDVVVDKDESGANIEPFHVPVVFGCPPWMATDEVDPVSKFCHEMRTKISNLLRICHCHGHQELIISAKFERLPARQVASLFREVLLESGDAVGAFRRVVFALPKEEVPAKVILAFQEEFRYFESDARGSWKDGKLLVPIRSQSDHCLRSQADICLDVDLQEIKWSNLRGTKVQVFPYLFSSREHQQWRQLPCGRIVLAAFPQLCLSAEVCRCGAQVHMWHRVDKNDHLQIWKTLADGGIALDMDQSLRLSISESREVLLCVQGKGHTLISWQCRQEECASP